MFFQDPPPIQKYREPRAQYIGIKVYTFNEISTSNYLQVDDVLRNTIIDNSERIATPF